jgi:hypothetical protein
VWTAVNSDATGNEIPAPPDARHNWLSLRRLGGQLAGQLDPEPALLSGDGVQTAPVRTKCGVSKLVTNDIDHHRLLGAPFLWSRDDSSAVNRTRLRGERMIIQI